MHCGRNSLRGIVIFVSNFGIVAGMLLGICLRNRWLTAAALLLWGFNSFLQGQIMYYGSLACMIISLATEFEWEKAARGENGFEYPWGNEFNSSNVNSFETYSNDFSFVFPHPRDGDKINFAPIQCFIVDYSSS